MNDKLDPKPAAKPGPAPGHDALRDLEYPRMLHKPAVAADPPAPALQYLSVADDAAARKAIAEGWFLDANEALAKGAQDAARPAK
jgi:hypothetical protein